MKYIYLILCLSFLLVPTVSAVTWVGVDVPAQVDFDVYFNSSNTNTIFYNLSEGGLTTIDYWFIPDIKFIFGGLFE
jgi:hypothetical protein